MINFSVNGTEFKHKVLNLTSVEFKQKLHTCNGVNL